MVVHKNIQFSLYIFYILKYKFFNMKYHKTKLQIGSFTQFFFRNMSYIYIYILHLPLHYIMKKNFFLRSRIILKFVFSKNCPRGVNIIFVMHKISIIMCMLYNVYIYYTCISSYIYNIYR